MISFKDGLLETASFSPYPFQENSAWIGHLPFAAWLIRTIDPKIFVELGSHWGHSYFAFCQSVSEADLATKCYAVDTWQGDEHAGSYGDEVFHQVNAHNQAHYSTSSCLLRMTFDDARNYFSDGSIELLHIDGLHTYEAVKHDFETWLPKLAPGAVVLFHDTNVRERGFGVWKLWEELQNRYPNNLEFLHSYGLGVLQLDGAADTKKLAWLDSDSVEQQQLKDYFSALGKKHLERFELGHAKIHATNLTQAVTERDGQIVHLNQSVAERDGQVSSLTQAVTERDGQIVHLNQSVAERDGQVSSLTQAVTERDKELSKLNQDMIIILNSRSWSITRPLRWFSLQLRLIQEYGFLSRTKALIRKVIRKMLKTGVDYIKAHPAMRVRLHGWALRLGLRKPLQNFYMAIQTKVTDGVPNLRNLVVSSYPAWSEHFDTPSMEALDRMASQTDSKPPVLVVARFDKMSQCHAQALALRLIATVGQPWVAVFLFSSDCNSLEIIGNIQFSTRHDTRIYFDQHACSVQADLTILIEGGALPRAHALRIFADTLRNSPDALVAYSDEDRYFDRISPCEPWFKPQFSPLLASQGVLFGRMLAFRDAGLGVPRVQEKLCSDSTDIAKFACDYAIAAGEQRVLHIPHVLFHDALEPLSPRVVEWKLPDMLPTTTIIIPTKDLWNLLGQCLDSLWLSDWPLELLEVIVVDNGSTDPQTLKNLGRLETEGRIRIISDSRPFNWSRLNNIAARDSAGELLVFLNNDTVVDDPAWLKKLAVHALRIGVGAVGCKLLYPDRTVQHGGVIAGIQGVAGHAHLFLQANEGGYRNLANITREVSAVTGACLAVSRKNYELAGGFNEDFRMAFNDVAFCFTLHTLGMRNVYVAEPLLIHYESKSRGYDDTPEKQALNREETQKAWVIHAPLMRNDPFYSPNLSLWKPYELSFAPRRRAAWDDPMSRPLKVMMLSSTHAIGHGVPVVLALQADALVKFGYEVIVAGPRSANDFPYPGCIRLEVYDPIDAATLAADLSVDLIIAQTPPFFSIARWTGEYPRVICYDHGEPPPDWFPDYEHRRAILAEKDLSLTMAASVYAISDAIAAESRTTVHGVIPEGNTHLGQWNEAAKIRRDNIRKELGWDDKFVILNVCRFHNGERIYKGVDTYAGVRDALQVVNAELFNRTIFVLCGKGAQEDVAAMRARGLVVHANITNDEMYDFYCAADAYANFSKWEGYNLGVAQALAMGLPTIASDIPAHRAFGIEVSDSASVAAKWLVEIATQGNIRTPQIWNWDRPLSQLIDVVSSNCQQSVNKWRIQL